MPESSISAELARVIGLLPTGEVRQGQREMAETVASVLKHGRHAAVTAGTGTGKSFAYLVPAILSGRKVVVATATKALQDQLASKDLPLVARALAAKPGFKWAVLKGRSNYLCRQQLVELEEAGRQASLEEAAAPVTASTGALSTGEQVVRLVEWSKQTKTGDRSELDFEPTARAWGSVSVTSEECPGAARCPSGADCFTELAKAKAGLADVVVVNMHLLGAHLRSGGAYLPEHEAVVIDEAHELEDILAASLGVEVSPGRLRALGAGARPHLASDSGRTASPRTSRTASARGGESTSPDPVEGLMRSAIGLEDALAEAKDSRLPSGLGDMIGEQARLALARLQTLEDALRKVSEPGGSGGASDRAASSRRRSGRAGSGGEPDGGQRALRALLAVERCREEFAYLLAAGSDEVVWVTGGERPAIRSAPLDVSNVVRAQLFDEMPVVLTSATLPPGIAERLGAPHADVTEIDVGSPFDYGANALLYCATTIRNRNSPEGERALHDEIDALVEAAGGRTLALFTSHRAMQAAAMALRSRIPWRLHVQGDLPKPALLQAFSSEEAACLFATMGFWQGVDVPGPSLSLVVIDKLPFPRPDDPLMSARREAAGEAGFRSVDLPRAATLLAQGVGRLIRTASDRGVVAVLDPRLATASYSGYVRRALPPMRRTRDRDEAVAYLRSLASQ